MRHLIERVLELADEEEGPTIRPTSIEEMDSNDAELRRLLESLQPRIKVYGCLLYTSPSPRDGLLSRMPSSA